MDIIIELLEAERDKLILRLNEVNKKLISLGHNSDEKSEISSKIIKPVLNLANKTLQTQALEVLKDSNRFLHKYEIAEVLKPYHKDKSDKKLDQRLAVELGKAREKGIIVNVKYSTSNQAYVWGSTTWLDDKGEIKKEHDFIVKDKTISEIVEF